MSDDPVENPYGAPTDLSAAPAATSVDAEHGEILKKFRQQIHALGGVWIFFGTIGMLLSAGLLVIALGEGAEDRELQSINPLLGGILLAFGILWIFIGVMSCLKHMWAVYLGLGLSYVSVVLNLINVKIIGVVIAAMIILQSHRVIGFANKLKAAGIPFNKKPQRSG